MWPIQLTNKGCTDNSDRKWKGEERCWFSLRFILASWVFTSLGDFPQYQQFGSEGTSIHTQWTHLTLKSVCLAAAHAVLLYWSNDGCSGLWQSKGKYQIFLNFLFTWPQLHMEGSSLEQHVKLMTINRGGIKHSLERLINKMKSLLRAVISGLPRTRRQRANGNRTKCSPHVKQNRLPD